MDQDGLPFTAIPIFINSFNRLSCLRRLVEWLCTAGYSAVHIVDNASSYPPLLSYLDGLKGNRQVTVTQLGQNVGPKALWDENLLDRLGIESEFVYTDPDVVPIAECPHDLVARLHSILRDYPGIAKAGCGLRLDDLPDTYRYKAHAVAWETQFWRKPAGPGLFYAPIDTTLALYRPKSAHCGHLPAIRTDWPYLASHDAWYINSAAPSEEDLFYRRTVDPRNSHWSTERVPPKLERYLAKVQRHTLGRPLKMKRRV
jgi:hypothetical protein